MPVTSLEAKSDATWRLCLPTRHQFTLAFMKQVQGSDEEDSENGLQICERELEIHLPVLANITLGAGFGVCLISCSIKIIQLHIFYD